MTLGRGTSTAARKKFNLPGFFKLTSQLPPEITFARNSTATTLNKKGQVIEVGVNEPRFAHDKNGTPLGLTIEPAATNRNTNNNVNPTSTSGFTTAGTGNLSIVSDSAELVNAGLDLICTSAMAYKAEATSGSTFTVTLPGTVGNTAAKAISLYARGEGVANQTAEISIGGPALAIAPSGESYKRYKHENLIPSASNAQFTIAVEGNQTLYFILNQLDIDGECSSVIPIEGSVKTRPADRAVFNDIHLTDWFDETQGFMVCRYRHNKLENADSYVGVINNGGTSHTMGIRIDQSSKSLRGYVRRSNSYQLSNANNDAQIENITSVAGIRWNSTQTEMISGGLRTISSSYISPTGLTTLDLGTRNAGIAPMNGYFESVYIGKDNITSEKLGSLLQKSGDYIVAAGGQSLIRGYFISQEDGTDGGKIKMRETLGALKPSSANTLVNGSTGGTAASKTSNATSYWWDLGTNSRGPAFDTFYFRIENARIRPTHILWGQGEDDSHQIGTNTSRTQYKQALEAIFNDMRQSLGSIPIYIQRIGRRSGFSNIGGIQTVREVQAEIIAENDWCFEAAETYDVGLHDSVHLDNAGYETTAPRNALALAQSDGAKGPSIISAIRAETAITVTLLHDLGTDFTPSSNISGFRFFDNDAEIALTSAVRADANTVTLTLVSAPLSSNLTLYYGYDSMDGINTANILKDNADMSMPLRTATISVN